MKRYLIHHDQGGTWNLLVDGDDMKVEHAQEGHRKIHTLDEFENSPDGVRLSSSLALAIARSIVR